MVRDKRRRKISQRVEEWSISDVEFWLCSNGFQKYVPQFCKEHEIDGKALLSITEDDLKTPPLELKVLGDIKRLSLALKQLKPKISVVPLGESHGAYSNNSHHGNHKRRSKHTIVTDSSDVESLGSIDSDDSGTSQKNELRPEIWKTVVALLYFLLSTWLTAIVMVIVHDRVPDMQTYPPLPDIFLDNVPLIPWAFAMCEFTGIVLFFIWAFVVLIHKHRFILLRRQFSLFGSVFLLRCVTMLITSLSVPGKHLQCKARPYGDWKQKLLQASLIWQGGGMSVQGVRTCGDYMFSGHTVALTLFNFFITEYTPRKMYYLHTFTWVFNLFGIFFILAAHEHYSIDVFIAFYISTRLFLYYHTLANNHALMRDTQKRTRIWFPLFYFFESGTPVAVPCEYELPFKIPQWIKVKWKNLK